MATRTIKEVLLLLGEETQRGNGQEKQLVMNNSFNVHGYEGVVLK